jgi:hypothetical protein
LNLIKPKPHKVHYKDAAEKAQKEEPNAQIK